MKDQRWNVHTSSIGNTDANVIAIIAYISSGILSFVPVVKYVAWLAPLIFFLIEKNSGFVKFHAMQAFILNLFGAILGFLVGIVLSSILAVATLYSSYSSTAFAFGFGAFGVVGITTLLIGLVILVFAIIAIFKAYKWEEYYIPLVGKVAEKFAGTTAGTSNFGS